METLLIVRLARALFQSFLLHAQEIAEISLCFSVVVGLGVLAVGQFALAGLYLVAFSAGLAAVGVFGTFLRVSVRPLGLAESEPARETGGPPQPAVSVDVPVP